MIGLKVLLTLAISLVANATPIPDTSLTEGVDFIKLDFQVKRGASITNATSAEGAFLLKRDDNEIELHNEQTFYMADVTLGTPVQTIGVLLDTGSSDLWVETDSNADAEYGTFDESGSSTFKNLGTPFSISYLDQSYATGTYGTDVYHLGSHDINDFQFAVAESTDVSFGVFGIGYPLLEATTSVYDNFPSAVKNAGLISKSAYSLYLNSPTASSGSLLLGAIDNAKYSGSLTTYPIVKTSGEYVYLQINLKSIGGGTGTASINAPAVLDSGTTLVYLPSSAITTIGNGLKFQYNKSLGYYVGACSSFTSTKFLSFNFGSSTIKAPLSQFSLGLVYSDGTTASDCALGLNPITGNNPIILGDEFLRSAYVVYDLDDNQVSLAQVNYTDDEDITLIS